MMMAEKSVYTDYTESTDSLKSFSVNFRVARGIRVRISVQNTLPGGEVE